MMVKSFLWVVAALLLANCARSEEPREVVVVLAQRFDAAAGAPHLNLINIGNSSDACFAPTSLPGQHTIGDLRVFDWSGNELPVQDQGHPVNDADDFVLGAGRRHSTTFQVTENLTVALPRRACVVLYALYTRCGDLTTPMVEAWNRGLDRSVTRELSAAWALEEGSLSESTHCRGRLGQLRG